MNASTKPCYLPTSSWHQLTPGGIIVDAGNAVDFLTGDWRSLCPIWQPENCRHCLLCWAVCPDNSILTADGKMTGIDLDHCKGCGLCSAACKFNAVTILPEGGVANVPSNKPVGQ